MKRLGFAMALIVAMVGSTAPAEALVTKREAERWRPNVRAAVEWAQGRAGDIDLAAVDMRHRLRHRDGYSTSPMASTFKVMLMVAYLRQGSVRDRPLTGEERNLLQPMIRSSANAPADRLDAKLGRGPLEALARRADMRSFRWNETWGLSRSSPRDQAFFLHRLQQYVPDRHWDFARNQLANVVSSQRWGIGRVPIRGWNLLFKGGWGSGTGWADHQVVLLQKNGYKVGLAVMIIDSPSHEYGKASLEGVFRRLLGRLPG